jgi:hypothetical protein
MAFVFIDLNWSVISKVVCSFFMDVGGSFSHRWFGNLRLEGENKMGRKLRLFGVYTLKT